MSKPLVIHLEPVRYSHKLWVELEEFAEVELIGEYSREEFIKDLHGKYANIVAMGRGYLSGQKVGMFNEELISHFPSSLKYIAHQGTGYDQIDVEALTKRGIQLSNCPNITTNSTADTNIFLMLGAMRNFEAGRQNLIAGKWPNGGLGAGVEVGYAPSRKVLGIIGMGDIGRAVRDRAESFGFEKIVYYNRSKLSPELEKHCEYATTLEELVSVSDVISINCPLNTTTYHLIDDSLIYKMKDGVVIVNTARGAVINEHDMIKHLKTGKIGAAGLDVFENEPVPSKELLDMPSVLALPHMGTHTVQAFSDMESWTIQNIRSALLTGKVQTIVPEQNTVIFN
mmetsp:Transcript_4367/g.4809  ORF Transcript_4367/g.4809 Transcript_4367/m.4809 type:complete len:340 (+) Transcript_4367:58-1077(+)